MINYIQNNKRKLLLLAICITLLLIAQFILMKMRSGKDLQVLITQDGEVYGSYSLSENQTIQIESAKGYNIITIENHKVSVTESDCDNQICVNTLAISQDNPGVIACLPHTLIIEIK